MLSVCEIQSGSKEERYFCRQRYFWHHAWANWTLVRNQQVQAGCLGKSGCLDLGSILADCGSRSSQVKKPRNTNDRRRSMHCVIHRSSSCDNHHLGTCRLYEQKKPHGCGLFAPNRDSGSRSRGGGEDFGIMGMEI